MKTWKPFLRLLLIGWFGAARLSASGEQPPATSSWFEQQEERSLLRTYDPTLISRRLLTGFEYEDHESGRATAEWKWNLRWAFPLAVGLALGLQAEAPLRWAEEAGEDATGFGDLETRAGLVGRFTETSRWGLGMNAKFPTASDPLLGDGVIELRPIAAVRWQTTDWLELGANVEYNFTPRDEGADRVSALELKVPVFVTLTDKSSAFASYNPRWNDVKRSWRHRLELGVTQVFGSRRQCALSLGAELPLTDESFAWKGKAGLTIRLR